MDAAPPAPAPAQCCATADTATQRPCALCSRPTCAACRSTVNSRGVCAACFAQIAQELDQEKAGAESIPGAVAGGLIGALVGGGAWALVAIATGLAIGYVAIGVGFVAGYGVYLGAGRRKGKQLQAIAVGCSLLGLLLGKYFIVAHEVLKELPDSGLSYLDSRMFQIFLELFSKVFRPFDILWMVLALGAAIRVLRPTQAFLRAPRAGR